jgi:NitT/TauT family transport system ATP-binding protein
MSQIDTAVPPVGARPASGHVQIEQVSVSFERRGKGDIQAVDNVSLDIKPGEFVCLVGPSGCGKSTLLNAVAALRTPTAGHITLDGKPVSYESGTMGYMFQGDTLLPWQSALDNVLLPMQARKLPVDRDRARGLLASVGLEGFEDSYPRQLSGGMRKRVQLARLRAQDPMVMLMDEPFGGLDAQTRLMIQEEFMEEWDRERKTTIFVTHDLSEAIGMADRIVLMSARPARIKHIYTVPFPRPRDMAGLTGTPAYSELFQELWESLKSDIGPLAEKARRSGL